MTSHTWLTAREFAALASITRRAATKALGRAMQGHGWNSIHIQVRSAQGKGGNSGLRYEVLLSSLSEHLQQTFLGQPVESPDCALPAQFAPPPKFVAARHQSDEERQRYAVLRLIAETETGTTERAQAIRDASHHHAVPVRTIQRWVERCETHGWDLDALGRKRPTDAGQQRVWISREFDRHFRADGHAQSDLAEVADWLTRQIAGMWQSPIGRAGWKRVRRDTMTTLRIECGRRGFDLPARAFAISRRRVEELRFHRAVDIMQHDAKRHDDAKPRIRRDNSKFAPMEQIVMDVKPLDCVLQRPDGSLAYPKWIAFLDTGTFRMCGQIKLMPQGESIRQEHVTEAFIAMVSDEHWGFPSQLYRDNGSEYAHFDLIREALKMVADDGVRVIINAKPYSGSSKPIESRFAVIDRHITSQMRGYTGSNRMDKKVQRVGRAAEPYPGTIEDFEEEFFLRLRAFEAQEIGSGPFMGRSPMEIYRDHLHRGWRRVAVHPLALDCAFAKQVGDRRVDRGAVTIGPNRYRHPELAAFTGRRVRIVQPYRRDSWPLAELPELGWVALEPDMLTLPGDISGAIEAGRMQKRHNHTVRQLKAKANRIDPLEIVRAQVEVLPTAAAPAPLIDMQMASEAERFAGARIEADAKRASQPTRQQLLIDRQAREDARLNVDLSRYFANGK